MRSCVRRFSFWAFAILFCTRLSGAADLESGKRAYDLKDYAAAFKELSPLAEQGNAEAQVILGKMYLMGQGVLKDPGEADKWFKASAQQGNADAQFYLGAPSVLQHVDVAEGLKWLWLSAEQGNQDAQLLLGQAYLQGFKELPRDLVQAEMWLRLAGRNNLPFYQIQLQGAEHQMNAAQIARGKALAEAWKPKHGLRPDAKPAPDEKPGADKKAEADRKAGS